MKNNKKDEQNVLILKSMANDNRLKILSLLYEHELSVGQLEKMVNLSQSALSQHLAILRNNNVVKTRRVAQTIYYRLENNLVRDILKLLE
ncbi:MAG: winged helix-turn-helix transcriptional regulator [Alphaproteobacteria bacterium]|nr:winged helix-turn-helix transcriptional regulator [Alphaproteobacteria bacterium]